MQNKELIDKYEILDKAKELAESGTFFNKDFIKAINNGAVEEISMLLCFTAIEIMSKMIPMPKEIKNDLLRAINTKCQQQAENFKQYRELSARQIELIPKTEKLRTKYAHQLSAHEFDDAHITASKLLDIYCFGTADGHTYQNLLQNAKEAFRYE